MVPFHSAHAAGSKFPRKVLGGKLEIFLEGTKRFERGLGSAIPDSWEHATTTRTHNFTFSVQ
jgi:hypothetical protein